MRVTKEGRQAHGDEYVNDNGMRKRKSAISCFRSIILRPLRFMLASSSCYKCVSCLPALFAMRRFDSQALALSSRPALPQWHRISKLYIPCDTMGGRAAMCVSGLQKIELV